MFASVLNNYDNRCQLVSIEQSCKNPMSGIATALNCTGIRNCPHLEGVFNYMNNWKSGSECGNVGGNYCVKGQNYISSTRTPLFAYCVQNVSGTIKHTIKRNQLVNKKVVILISPPDYNGLKIGKFICGSCY